jgi:hypothetical protein
VWCVYIYMNILLCFIIDQLIDPYGNASSSNGKNVEFENTNMKETSINGKENTNTTETSMNGKENTNINENQKENTDMHINDNINSETSKQKRTQKVRSPVPPFPFSMKLKIVSDICFGLLHLHNLNIVHGDIKPQNVLLDLAGVTVVSKNKHSSETNKNEENLTQKQGVSKPPKTKHNVETNKHNEETNKDETKQHQQHQEISTSISVFHNLNIRAAKISDMGLAKKLAAEQHSFSSSNAGKQINK